MPIGFRQRGGATDQDGRGQEASPSPRSLSYQSLLTASFLSLALICAVVGALGLYLTHAVVREYDTAATQTMPAISAIDRIKACSEHLIEATRLALEHAAPDATGFKTAADRLVHWQVQYAAVAQHEVSQRMATNVGRAVADYIRTGRGALDAVGAGGSLGPDVNRGLRRLDDAEAHLTASIDRASRFERANLTMGREATSGHLATATIFGAMEVAVVIALAIALGIRFGGPLTLALRALKHVTEQIAAGRLGTRVDLEACGPLAGFGRSLNTMAEHIEREHQKLTADIEHRIAAADKLQHDALHDPLTSLSNRAVLTDSLDRCIDRVRRSPEFEFALFFMDLDRFKMINDSLGHHVGDQLLIEAAQRLRQTVRRLDSVVRVDQETTSRLGGDEFAILVEGIKNSGRVVLIAERVQAEMSRPFRLDGYEVRVSASIGIALGSSEYRSANDLIRNADTAMYRAKLAGGGQHAVFDEVMHNEVKTRLRQENDLRIAVENQHFSVLYQPIMELASGRIIAFEALIRWVHPERGVIGSAQFVPMAEETGMIVPIGRWVLRQACRQLCAWRAQLDDSHPLSISVNVSPRQVAESDLVDEVEKALSDTGLDPQHLRLEITESMIMDNTRSISDVLHGLKRLGVQLYLDDFGTGYSSLSCLRNFPLDVLKIDREFVMNIGSDPEYAAVARAILTLAHNLNLRVTAEGIETPEQLALILDLGCEYGQGYYFAAPLEPNAAWAYIIEDQRRRDSA